MEYRIYKVSAKFVVKAAEQYAKFKEMKKEVTPSSLARALNTSEANARNALKAAEQLGLLDLSEKFWTVSNEGQKILFRKKLQSYKPFFEFIYLLNKGYTPDEAIASILEIFNIKRKKEDVLWTFHNWGIFAGIFRHQQGFEFVEELNSFAPSKVIELQDILTNEIKTKTWIMDILGKAKLYISEEEYEGLIKSVLISDKDPRESIREAGEILEDVLRKIAVEKNIDVSKRNGITEIAEELRKNKIISSKHLQILKGMSAFRNMAHHGKDKYEMKRWKLSKELALSYFIQVILCIKSLYYFLHKNQLNF